MTSTSSRTSPQVGDRGDREAIETEGETATDAIAGQAAAVGWGATIWTAGADHPAVAPALRHRRDLGDRAGSLRSSGSASSARLAVAAVKVGAPFGYLLILLGLAAPSPGCCIGSNPGSPTTSPIGLLAEMRIDLFRKLDTLAPAYLVRRRSGDLVALANQDIETIEYFFAHTVAPALMAILVPSTVLVDPRRHRLADRLGVAALRPFRRFGAGADAGADRSPRRSGPRGARPLGRLCYRNDPGPLRSRRVSGDCRSAPGSSWTRFAAIRRSASTLLRDLSVADRSARDRDRARRARGCGGRRAARRRASS